MACATNSNREDKWERMISQVLYCCRGPQRKSRAVDGRGGGDPWADGQLVDACEVRVWYCSNILFAAVGAVGIDPCDEFSEAERVNLHVVVFAAHSDVDELARVGQMLHRTQRYVACGIALAVVLGHNGPCDAVVFRVHAAKLCPADQRNIRLFEHSESRSEGQIEFFSGLAVVLVAFSTILIEHRLNKAGVADTFGAPWRRCQFGRLASQGNTALGRSGYAVQFVTAKAAALFTRHHAREGTHRL